MVESQARHMPRVAVLSVREQRSVPWFGWIRAFEDLLTEAFDATLLTIADEPSKLARRVEGRLRAKTAASALGIRPHRIEPRERPHFDVLIVVVNDFGDLQKYLYALDGWEELAPRRILVHIELWPFDATVPSRLRHAVHDPFDHIFVGMASAVDRFQDITSGTVHLLRAATDTRRYRWLTPQHHVIVERPITVYEPGRRSTSQHRALQEFCAADGRFVLADSAGLPSVEDVDSHHTTYAKLVSRSHAMMCNFARFNDPARAEGQREIGARHFEALAGGCIILGDPPTSVDYDELVDGLPGVVPWASDATTVPDRLVELLARPDLLAEIAVEHRTRALLHHDLAHRVAALCAMADLPCPDVIHERIDALRREADQLREANGGVVNGSAHR